MRSPITIRPVQDTDAPALAPLLGELGYPTTASEVVPRLRQLSREDAVVLVATVREDVVGMVTGMVIPAIHRSSPVGLVTALVVAERARGLGAGAALLDGVRDFAARHGAVRLTVTTAESRVGAQAFYAHLGWEYTGRRFAISIDPAVTDGSRVDDAIMPDN